MRNKILLGVVTIITVFVLTSCTQTAEKWYKRAEAEAKTNNLDRAILDLNDALALDSNYADAYLLKAKIELQLGKKDDAEKNVKKAADLGNKEASLIVQQYFQVYSEEEINNKIKTQDSLAVIYPNRPEPFYNISNVYFDAHQYKKAIEYCDKAISIDTNYAPAYYNKGACLIKLEQRANGCEFINKAATMGYDMALQMKPTCDAILKGKN